jgi:cytochrome c oxidase cbb3-type subunit 2
MSSNNNSSSGGFFHRLQEKMEMNITALTLMIAVVVSVGGIVMIVPLFYINNTVEDNVMKADGTPKNPELASIKPYTPLQLAGRYVFIREGCYLCHSQMIRPFRDERERYGHYSLAAESKYDHPFQWGSKRTGPDLARVGGKYSDEWHYAHMHNPRSVVPESIMPNYPWLEKDMVDADLLVSTVKMMRMVGVPYTDADIQGAAAAVKGKTELQALVAFLQGLGTSVVFEEGKDYRD